MIQGDPCSELVLNVELLLCFIPEVLYKISWDPLDCKDLNIAEVRVVETSEVLKEEINRFMPSSEVLFCL